MQCNAKPQCRSACGALEGGGRFDISSETPVNFLDKHLTLIDLLLGNGSSNCPFVAILIAYRFYITSGLLFRYLSVVLCSAG